MHKNILHLITTLSLLLTPFPALAEKGSGAPPPAYDQSAESYEETARERPDSPEARYNLGGAYYKKGEYDKALREYDEAIKLDPEMAEAHYNRGDALYRMGQYDAALESFKKAESLAKDPDARHNIDITLAKIKKKRQEQNQQGKQDKQGGKNNSGQNARGGGKDSRKDDEEKPSGGGGDSGPRLSERDVQKLLDRQREEEKRLRSYFRPGKKRDPGREREAQIEQMLRGAGVQVPLNLGQPGRPQVEKDW